MAKKVEIYAILNLTPDSFYGGSRVLGDDFSADDFSRRVEDALAAGADVIDIGGFSTRPGHAQVTEDEEFRRLYLAMEVLSDMRDVRVSVDTFRPSIVRRLHDRYGPFVVNDVGGGHREMLRLVGELQLPYVLMSSEATSAEVDAFFERKILEASELGVHNVMLDPGFGFGKSLEENFEVLQNLERFGRHGLPVFVGISRKSMIFRALGTDPAGALNGTSVVHTMALERGATVLRIHDVAAAVECTRLFDMLSTRF